jgi:predicted small secreted protein
MLMGIRHYLFAAALVGLVIGLASLTGCNTVKGVGNDFVEGADAVHGWMYSGDPAPTTNQYVPPQTARR